MQHLTDPPPFSSSDRSTPIGHESGVGELLGEAGGGRRVDDVQAVGDGVEPEHVRVGRGYLDGVREELEQPGARLVTECRWVVGDGGVVEHRKRGVEVIEARVDELEADHRHPDGGGDLVVRPAVGAETIARQHDRADDEQVALAFVDVARLGRGGSRGGSSTRRRRRIRPRAAGRRTGRRRPCRSPTGRRWRRRPCPAGRRRAQPVRRCARVPCRSGAGSPTGSSRRWVSTVVEVSIHGLMAYSTAKKVGGVIA